MREPYHLSNEELETAIRHSVDVEAARIIMRAERLNRRIRTFLLWVATIALFIWVDWMWQP
jgi:hypothetical protein